MEKKGLATGIDWMIAMGIFLVYLSLVFVFFRPGITPVFDSETLLDIVQDNFENSTQWEITKVPIFIEPVEYITTTDEKASYKSNDNPILLLDNFLATSKLTSEQLDPQKIEFFHVPQTVKEQPNELSSEGKTLQEKCKAIEKKDEDTQTQQEIALKKACEQLLDKEKPETQFTIESQSIPNIEKPKPYFLEFNLSDNNPYFNVFFFKGSSTGQKVSAKVLMQYSTEITNPEGATLTDMYVGKAVTEPPSTLNHETRAKYSLGVAETLSGISTTKFINIETKDTGTCDYECLKLEWGFPISKEFKIKISDPKTGVLINYPKHEPSLTVNVFTRQFNTFVLSDDGIRTPVVVSLLIW